MRHPVLTLIFAVFTLPGCSGGFGPPAFGDAAADHSPARQSSPTAAARAVLDALMTKDGERLAQWAHPQLGVRFSPYAFVDPQRDVVMHRPELERFWNDTTPRLWGTQDGTGDPIRLTPSQYAQRYILDRAFTSANIQVNRDQARGNSLNNAAANYPAGTRVEYYLPPGANGLDWRALRLVFQSQGSDWYLVGIIHDEWTT